MISQQNMANAIRMLSVQMIERANSGHPGLPLGFADVMSVLWQQFLRFDAKKPDWANRDRFILSNGHGSSMLYSLLYLAGYEKITIDELKSFRQFGAITAGHPEKDIKAGIEFSTGPLGQGLAGGVGMAIAERALNAKYGNAYINHKTYVAVGDGCLMEGISEEAISLAGHLKLNNLIVLWDNNKITIDGTTDITQSTDMHKRFQANNWRVLSCNGHNYQEIESALSQAQTSDKPVFIDCATTIGYGLPTKSGTPACHGAPVSGDEMAGLRQNLNWTSPDFIIPDDILSAWRTCGTRHTAERMENESITQSNPAFIAQMAATIPATIYDTLYAYKQELITNKTPIATRKASSLTLDKMVQECDVLMGGSADLAGACYTKTTTSTPISATNYAGNYIHYGIREHAMAGIMNGLSAHGGFIPFSSTFLSFVDYMKPAIRLASLMKQQEIFVLTHDSIAVGEDGPTHQPVEQLVSLRATPNLLVFRPADSVEVADCYELILQETTTPSAIVLSRQNLPVVRKNPANLSAKGAYILHQYDTTDITLLATGSEVSLALEIAEQLATENIFCTTISMPCQELFDRQPISYQQSILGTAPIIAIEAASALSWHKYVKSNGAIISIDTFGTSAPAKTTLFHYGFTATAIIDKIKSVSEK